MPFTSHTKQATDFSVLYISYTFCVLAFVLMRYALPFKLKVTSVTSLTEEAEPAYSVAPQCDLEFCIQIFRFAMTTVSTCLLFHQRSLLWKSAGHLRPPLAGGAS